MIHWLHRRRKWLLGLLAGSFFGGLLAAWIVGGALCAATNHPVPVPKDFPVEAVSFSSESGSTISGWLTVPATNHGVVILQHGLRADKSTLVEHARFLTAAGYAVLLFDFQAHGESPGQVITFGYLESRDAQAAVAFCKKRFPSQPIGVIGISMGAAAIALAQPPLEVQALVLEMVYPDVVMATKNRIEMRLGRLGRYLSPLLTSQIPFRAGCLPEALSPINAVKKIRAPKLFMAGTADRETKFAEAQNIFASAAEPKTFVVFEGARHQDYLQFSPAKYQSTVLTFLAANLK